jgi:hypothetical protein
VQWQQMISSRSSGSSRLNVVVDASTLSLTAESLSPAADHHGHNRHNVSVSRQSKKSSSAEEVPFVYSSLLQRDLLQHQTNTNKGGSESRSRERLQTRRKNRHLSSSFVNHKGETERTTTRPTPALRDINISSAITSKEAKKYKARATELRKALQESLKENEELLLDADQLLKRYVSLKRKHRIVLERKEQQIEILKKSHKQLKKQLALPAYQQIQQIKQHDKKQSSSPHAHAHRPPKHAQRPASSDTDNHRKIVTKRPSYHADIDLILEKINLQNKHRVVDHAKGPRKANKGGQTDGQGKHVKKNTDADADASSQRQSKGRGDGGFLYGPFREEWLHERRSSSNSKHALKMSKTWHGGASERAMLGLTMLGVDLRGFSCRPRSRSCSSPQLSEKSDDTDGTDVDVDEPGAASVSALDSKINAEFQQVIPTPQQEDYSSTSATGLRAGKVLAPNKIIASDPLAPSSPTIKEAEQKRVDHSLKPRRRNVKKEEGPECSVANSPRLVGMLPREPQANQSAHVSNPVFLQHHRSSVAESRTESSKKSKTSFDHTMDAFLQDLTDKYAQRRTRTQSQSKGTTDVAGQKKEPTKVKAKLRIGEVGSDASSDSRVSSSSSSDSDNGSNIESNVSSLSSTLAKRMSYQNQAEVKAKLTQPVIDLKAQLPFHILLSNDEGHHHVEFVYGPGKRNKKGQRR